MKFLFFIQGEGRGHTTQAIALKEMIESSGHTVELALIGSQDESVPSIARQGFQEKARTYRSPTFVYGNDRKVSWIKTITHNLAGLPSFFRSLRQFRQVIKATSPDVIVNFYEPLFGLYNLLLRPKAKVVAIAHQFMFLHRGYKPVCGKRPKGFGLLKWFTVLVGARARKLALSFYPASPMPNVTVVPPLLRNQLFEVARSASAAPASDRVVAYLMNSQYLAEFVHASNPLKAVVFTGVGQATVLPPIEVRPVDGEQFLAQMAVSRGVCCTAGFETVAEGMYFGLPVVMRPIGGHLEQQMNAVDAEKTSARCRRVDDFYSWPKAICELEGVRKNTGFRTWVDSARQHFHQALGL